MNWLQTNVTFTEFSYLYPVAFLIMIGLSAGLAEESSRFFIKYFFIRPAVSPLSEPIIFGLGHGFAESVYLLLPLFLQGYPVVAMIPAMIERMITIVVHICLTVVVWNGFQLNKKYLYLLLAILLHGAIDSIILLIGSLQLSVWAIEGIIALEALLLLLYGLYSKRYYLNPHAPTLL